MQHLIESLAAAWLKGGLIKPFSGLPMLKGAADSLVSDSNKSTVKRACIGMFVTLLIFVVILVCFVRMMREKLPVFALCALLLLGWYVALGYSNPDKLIASNNVSNNYDAAYK